MRCMLHNHQGLSSNRLHTHKHLSAVAQVGEDRWIPEAFQPTRLAKFVSSMFCERTCPRSEVESSHISVKKDRESDIHTHT